MYIVKFTALAAALLFLEPIVANAGSVDGGTAPRPTDTAVTGTIGTTGGGNTVVGSGASITYTNSPGQGWTNTAVGSSSSINGANNTALGASSSATGSANIAIGNQSTAGNGELSMGNVAIGVGSNAINNVQGDGTIGATAIGYQAQATGRNSVAVGSGSIATQNNAVSFGGDSNTPTRSLINVSDGVANTDAATVGQMKAYVDANGGTDVIARTTANAAFGGAQTAQISATQAQAVANTALSTATEAKAEASQALSKVNGLSQRVDQLAEGVGASMAMASATNSATVAALRSERGFGMGIGVGTYQGQTQSALSFATALPKVTFSGSFSLTGTPSVQLGAGWSF